MALNSEQPFFLTDYPFQGMKIAIRYVMLLTSVEKNVQKRNKGTEKNKI